ncbi:unnamed protein product [Caenorhabditis brenneri]
MENYNLRIAEYEGLIDVLKREIVRLNHNLRNNQYASAAERERDARQSVNLEVNRIIVHIQDAMGRLTLGDGGDNS